MAANYTRFDDKNLNITLKSEVDHTNRRMKVVTRIVRGATVHFLILEPRWHLLKTGKFASMLRCIGRIRRFRDELCVRITFSF